MELDGEGGSASRDRARWVESVALEDARGVDISQIKRLLAMTPRERLADLRDAVRRLDRMEGHVRGASQQT